MKTVGFPISDKKNEKGRCLLPIHAKIIKNKTLVYVETGYGSILGFDDSDYVKAGINVVEKEEVLKQDIICDAKIGDASYLKKLRGQTLFGWVHAVQNKAVTDILIHNKLTAYAWEDMNENGRHIFWQERLRSFMRILSLASSRIIRKSPSWGVETLPGVH